MDTTTPSHSPSAPADEQEEFVILVAVSMYAATREAAELALHQALPKPGADPGAAVESWWIAEDDRRDGSDNDSAVFVPKGSQASADAALRTHARPF